MRFAHKSSTNRSLRH